MFRMEVDSSPKAVDPSHYDLVVQRLSRLEIPDDVLNEGPSGLIAFVKSNRIRISDLVSALLPTDEEEVDDSLFCDCLVWLQWLMFEGDPGASLQQLASMSSDQQGVCGAVWGNNDIAYRCRTCEHDPTCAICVPCFKNGNHKDHDYSVIYTGGGCCDCGDITAWKREGFCSKHKGAEQIQPLPKHIAESLGPVLDLLLSYWKNKIVSAESFPEESPRVCSHIAELKNSADALTFAIVEMLLGFCKNSESLLSFISQRVYSSPGLLDVLLRAERFMDSNAVVELHELLLKMLGEPNFKYEFAKVFVLYYPTTVNAAISGGGDTALKKYTLLSTFSVQIFTVPTITPRLVEEMNMLGMMFQCLESMFFSCSGDDGRLEVTKWASFYETTLRVIEDIRFVMSHSAVPKYLCHHRRDLIKTWMKILAFVQGMNAQKREAGSHLEDENENAHLPFILCSSISNILSLLVGGAFSVIESNDNIENYFISTQKVDCEDQDSHRHAKVGRLSQQSSIGSSSGKSIVDHEAKTFDGFSVPSSALWLTYECLRSIDCWLGLDETLGLISPSSLKTSEGSGNNFSALKRTLSKIRRGRYMFKSSTVVEGQLAISHEVLNNRQGCLNAGVRSDCRQPVGQGASGGGDDIMLEGETNCEVEGLRLLTLSNWPNIKFDVSSQEISIHIPLHHLLAMVLRRALKECYGESRLSYIESGTTNHSRYDDFLGHILDGCHPYGFSGFLLEHPLRLRVFCAQVRAGMWRRNGDAPILLREWYRSIRWSEQGQEYDLFLLQCCAALAPPDLYVQRILERFGLSNYLSFNLELPSEYEPVLVTEMLSLLIQIVKERRFCGLTTTECLQRELVYKLSIGDATRSQLLKSLTRDLSKVDELQEVLDKVAEYSRPSGMVQGKYKLRSLYWKELDLYHPRWNSRDLQTAEERYLRFCNASALTMQLPKWTKIYPPLRGIAKVATCKALLQIVRAVLFYAVFTENRTASRAPDGVLLTALHLLALALDVCRLHKESGDTLCYVDGVIPTLAFASEDITMGKCGDQCLLSLLVYLMRMHETEKGQNFTEPGNFDLASLILSLIKTLVELDQGCMMKLQKIAPQLASKYLQSLSSDNARDTGLVSNAEMHKAKARERQAAILEKMRAQQLKFMESFKSGDDDEMADFKTEQSVSGPEISNETEDSAQVICSLCRDSNSESPVSFVVLLQKSRLLSLTDRGPPSWEQVIQSGKEHVSDEMAPSNDLSPILTSDSSDTISPSQLENLAQSTVNDFASIGQPQEVNKFIEFIKARFPSIKNVELPCMTNDARERMAVSVEVLEKHMYWSMRGFPSSFNNLDFQLCKEELSVNESHCTESLLVGKYVAALPKEHLNYPSASQASCSGSVRMVPASTVQPVGSGNLGPSGCDGVYVSSCGHAVHHECLNLYLVSLKDRHIRRLVFEGGQIVDPDQGQFLCPVCRGLANAVLPALPGGLRKAPQPPTISTNNLMDVSSPSTTLDDGSLCLQYALSLLRRAADIARNHGSIKALPVWNSRIKPEMEPITRLLCGMYFPGQDKLFETGRASPSAILWDTLKYSLMSLEIAARSKESSLSPNYSVGALFKELNSSSGSLLSLLLDAIQSMRTTDSLTALLRYQGIQLFVRSLCHGTCPLKLSKSHSWIEGDLLSTLQTAEQGLRYPDIELWNRASEPILAHDAFSSFMWVLFCLPWPILSCKESYISLVHVFYVVTVTQGIITYLKKRQPIDTEMGFDDTLITDIYKLIGGCGEATQYFESYCIGSACDIHDAIRSLTFPYLRRCALFWKLINCSKKALFGGGSDSWSESVYAADDLQLVTDTMEELPEVKRLEKMFKIPPFDLVISNEESRLTASRWLGHFLDVFKAHKAQHILRCNPAVPFKLMSLPYLYQDLLQRYIKKSCPDCGKVKKEPALCLLCGKLCSPNWKTCCRESGCQAHAMVCGAGIGVFLLVRSTTILLQRVARQSPWPSPYLDAFGEEEDIERSRGKPLYLNEERYATLTHMVASHGLDRSSKLQLER
ncbi:E3 ubiquitin-protein ligase PRT6 isoform X2 [Andrographis paniculata]|uniref:E3 ubiquitin-protein ligase PRT6 isoform X2 n=1 Tax=Andrographis paniculata TaxID=175694 RepID=UPI0021E902F6|nr:E3 ubiquitin-protein ligase PRT6 isoform X2 [Andrographis paniculata]XP_051113913.1 E3 ubiquitin-protein ligase PRT6 isoform X2 [Andrographis paniculata]